MDDKLYLTKEEKEDIFTHLWENMFDVGEDDVHYLDQPMVKLLKYLDIQVPQVIEIKNHLGTAYTIELVANQ